MILARWKIQITLSRIWIKFTESISHDDNQNTLTTSLLFHLLLFTNPTARAGYDTKSIFKPSLTGLNSEFSFS